MTNVQSINVDPAETAFYNRLAQTWWNAEGPMWPLHLLNELRAGFIRDEICRVQGRSADVDQPLQGLSILDIGCGGGLLSEAMASLGARVHGIDVAKKNIEVARLHAGSQGLGVRYECLEAEVLVDRGVTYDVVLNMEVVEHVPKPDRFLQTCSRLVAEGGTMFVATINRNLLSLLTAKIGAEYILRWLPRGTHQWRRFVKPAEAEAELFDNGLRVVTRRGVQVNPLNRRFSITRRMPVNYMLTAVKPASAERQPDDLPQWLLRELRSDHAGELGAVAIYRGILAAARDAAVREFARRHRATERMHLQRIEHVLPPGERSSLLPLCRAAGFSLGFGAALFGRKAVYATIDAVENFVDRHYTAQIERLADEPRLASIRAQLEACREDELAHRDEARRLHGNGRLARWWGRLVEAGSRQAVKLVKRW